MNIELGYGNSTQALAVSDDNLLGVLYPNEVAVAARGREAVRRALENPIGTATLAEIVRPGEKIVIITSDITRPLPSYEVLPVLLDVLFAAGVAADDVTVVFALGSHRRHSPAEMKALVGEAVYVAVRCVDSDPDDFVNMGCTTVGTPVDITAIVVRADRRIGLGNIEYHYFAGYSGGAKAIMPGVSTRAAIQANHSKMTQSGAFAGSLAGNPVRADIEEAVGFCPLDFIVNVVLDERKQIIQAVAGHFIHAHRAGCAFLDSLYRKEIPALADIVVASQGGAPKDINLYQTQKALDNAAQAVKKGGVIILAGCCTEGLGERVFEEWMTAAKQPGELIERIGREFRLGGHKAAAIAMVLEKADIYLVSEMQPDFVRSIFLTPFDSVQAAFDAALAKLGKDASVLVMPFGGSTLPVKINSKQEEQK